MSSSKSFLGKIKNLGHEQWTLLNHTFNELKQSGTDSDFSVLNWKESIQQILDSVIPKAMIKVQESSVSIKISKLFDHFDVIAGLIQLPKKFEWVDGSLVNAVRNGGVFLVDEISLANDNVLERLNSLLESERSLFMEKSEDIWSRGKALWDLLGVNQQAHIQIQQSKAQNMFHLFQ